MGDRIIQQADLSGIERSLNAVHGDLQTIDSNVNTVDNNVRIVYDEIGKISANLNDFMAYQMAENEIAKAETRLIKIRQELSDKYGHYNDVRRSATGILQADDLGIVRKEIISDKAEEFMLSSPGYWLAPCLVALSAWISDQPELAEKALKEGIKRDDEKTSLFFALICRRADRKPSCLKWTQRYLENQDAENIDRKTIIILDAYSSGLLGADSDGVVSRQISGWLEHLSDKPGFLEQQTEQWSNAINLKRKPVDTSAYTYLRKYSKTWPTLQDIMEGATLHGMMLSYFSSIFDQEISTDTVKAQLDEILKSLVTDYDDEEMPLRKEEKFNQYVLDFAGDVKRAQRNMDIEKQSEENKDFTQLLTDAAMRPDTSHASASTQKFAIALSRDWIANAYNDVVAKNRMKIPHQIEINVDSFNDVTTDGTNETELIGKFNQLIDSEKENALAQCVLGTFDQYCLFGGGAIAAIGVGMAIAGSTFMGLLAIIAGIGLVINHYQKKKKIAEMREAIEKQFEEKRNSGLQILRATVAEIVDYRSEFAAKDGESQKVLDFLEQISPEQYVRQLSESSRKVRL